MKETKYSQNFWFRQISGQRYRYTDVRHGAAMHFLVYMRQGSARFVGRDQTVRLPQGQFLYIPKGEPYQSYWQGQDQILFDSIGFQWFPEEEGGSFAMQSIAADEAMCALADAIAADRRVSSKSLANFFQLLSHTLPKMSHNGIGGDIFQRVQYYLYQYPQANMLSVADHCNVSQSGLYSIFSRCGWGTPNDLRQRIRVEKAIELLQTTDQSVEWISENLGFSSTSYFRKILKKHTGKTPSAIRKVASRV
ncbi:MAG: AraC family transcriptional regulator [Oscillospiraceae bacterium]|nr:AraC family transcriptional regulator [Oscillospiraceae bacterium]